MAQTNMNRLLLSILLGSFTLALSPKTLAQVPALSRPKAFCEFISKPVETRYYRLTYDDTSNFEELDRNSGFNWQVWCTEEGAPIFDDPNNPNKIGALSFRETLVVHDLDFVQYDGPGKENWLLVRKTSSMVPDGWVRASSVLLSPWALETRGGIGRKALVVPTLAEGKIINDGLPKSQIYNNPNAARQHAIFGLTAGRFRVLYIMKESDDAYLLSTSPTLDNSSAAATLLGWMPKGYTQEWDKRLAYAPSQTASVIAQVSDGQIPLFNDLRTTQAYVKTCYKGPDSDQRTMAFPTSERLHIPNVPAFPFIGESSRDAEDPIREILTITGTSMNPSDAIDRIKKDIEQLEQQISKINLFFIVDATASMKNYYPAIAQSILKVNELASQNLSDQQQVTVKVGFGVYRDYLDGTDAVRTLPLQSFDSNRKDEILAVQEYCTSKNPKHSEAVYNGILENLNAWSPKKEESNVVILIGDEGNHPVDPQGRNALMVAEKLEEINASLFVFQSNAFMTESSNRFRTDALNWIASVMSENGTMAKIEDGVIGAKYPSERDILSSRKHAKLFYPTKAGVQADAEVMANHIQSDLLSWLTEIQIEIDELQSQYEGTVIKPSTPEQREREIQRLMEKFNRSRADIEEWYNRGGDLAEPKFCSISQCATDGDLEVLDSYVFISNIEYTQISEAFNQLKQANTDVDKRDSFVAMLEHVVKTQVGSTAELEEYRDETIDNIWLEFFQVNCNIEEINQKKLRNLASIPDEDFNTAYEILLDDAKEWDTLPIDRRKWKAASSRNKSFYWIEADYFPGY